MFERFFIDKIEKIMVNFIVLKSTMKPLINTILLFISITLFAQKELSKINYVHKTEEFILNNQLDSAQYFFKEIKKGSYKNILGKLIKKQRLTYDEYYRFTSYLSNRRSVKYKKVSDYIDKNIPKPLENDKINIGYFETIWTQVYKLRDEGDLKSASKKQKKLEEYINSFNDKDLDVIKAKIKATTHQIVLYQIQEDVKNGKKLCLESLNKAKKLKDKRLQIMFLYYLSDFLVIEKKLQEYIGISEESLKLENDLPNKSSFYLATIEHLINAYNFKGGHNNRVIELIDIIYSNDDRRINSYSLYAQQVSGLNKTSSILKNKILKKFEVKDVSALISKFKLLGKDLNSNDYYHLINYSSNALSVHGFKDMALRYKEEAVNITRKIYSKELTESLASFKSEQAIKEKEKVIVHEKEKNKLYLVISVLAIVLLIISLFVLNKIKRQTKELSDKNTLIKKTLKEKELLVKEVHHRVKNNFQIVSSLLELQTKGIEDEKALELANEGKNRVKSMALIHQKLYQNENGLINFDEYIKLLVKELSILYTTKNNVDTTISSDNINFDVDTAIPLGLIINEIITNSYKYAFKETKDNKLSIAISKENSENYKLTIEDNGPGIESTFDVKKAKSLGLRLVNRLVKQLHGSLNQSNSNGAKFEIYFKDSNTRHLIS